MPEPSQWTAVMFLEATAEFARMTPDRDRWNEEALRDNAPRLLRLRRLQALACAFDIQPGFEALLEGTFLRTRPDTAYVELEAFINEELRRLQPGIASHWLLGWSRGRAFAVYRRLVKYLLHAYELLAWNSGVLEAAGIFSYQVHLVAQANVGVAQAIGPVEDLVGRFIAPDNRTFSVEELRRFGWPPEDLWKIDAENL